MLIQFTVGNFRTFKEKASLNLLASNYDKETHENENIIKNKKFGLRILKSAVIYGANASGKSKFIEAMGWMRWLALNSFRRIQVSETISEALPDIKSFELSTDTEKKPSFFEVLFMFNQNIYRYGFEINSEAVCSEWLYLRSQRKEILIFEKESNAYTFHPEYFKVGKNLKKQELLRDNSLILSSAAQTNNAVVAEVISWFKKLRVISGIQEEGYTSFTMNQSDNPKLKSLYLNFLRAADLNIEDFFLKKEKINEIAHKLPSDVRDVIVEKLKQDNPDIISDVMMKHKKFDENQNFIGDTYFSLEDDESAGTSKFFALAGPIFDVLRNAHTLVIDELDSKLHPNLVCKITQMFNSKKLNPKNAQLIFNTHNTNLLDSRTFRRDQIWFTEKNRYGAASLYSLSDIINIRKDEDFERRYIEGRYGAVPYLGSFDELLKDYQKEI